MINISRGGDMKKTILLSIFLIFFSLFLVGCKNPGRADLPDSQYHTKWISVNPDIVFFVEESSVNKSTMISYQTNMHGFIKEGGVSSEIVVEKRIGYFSNAYYFYMFDPKTYQDPFERGQLLFWGKVRIKDDKCIIKVKFKEDSIGYNRFDSSIKEIAFTRDDSYCPE